MNRNLDIELTPRMDRLKEADLLTKLLLPFCIVFTTLTWGGGLAAAPAQVILLRHAEEPAKEADRHLSDLGRTRAEALVSLLITNSGPLSNLPPVALFASKPSKDGEGLRPRETLEPLAKRLGVQVQSAFSRKDHARLIRQIVHDPAYEGKTVVICWVHEYLDEMAGELGAGRVAPWRKEVYDRMWVVRWVGARAVLTDTPQRLLSGDSKQ